jgi:NADH-quinone oxidoreductase subunit K
MIHMEYYLVVSTIMMFAGIYGFFTRRNTLAILISVELMLNATDINFAVFNRFLFPGGMEGYFFALLLLPVPAYRLYPLSDETSIYLRFPIGERRGKEEGVLELLVPYSFI